MSTTDTTPKHYFDFKITPPIYAAAQALLAALNSGATDLHDEMNDVYEALEGHTS